MPWSAQSTTPTSDCTYSKTRCPSSTWTCVKIKSFLFRTEGHAALTHAGGRGCWTQGHSEPPVPWKLQYVRANGVSGRVKCGPRTCSRHERPWFMIRHVKKMLGSAMPQLKPISGQVPVLTREDKPFSRFSTPLAAVVLPLIYIHDSSDSLHRKHTVATAPTSQVTGHFF